MKGSDFIIHFLARNGISHMFGMSGANIEGLLDSALKSEGKVIPIIAKHEFSAVSMADGHFRSSGKVAAVAVTSGGGAFNTFSGLAEAFASHVPLIAFIGQVNTNAEGLGAFQDSSGKKDTLNALKIFKQVSGYCKKVSNIDQLPKILLEAYTCAETKQRPSVILLPKNIQDGIFKKSPKVVLYKKVDEKINIRKLKAQLIEVSNLLSKAQRPLFILGEEIRDSFLINKIGKFIINSGFRVLLTPEAKSTFDNHRPEYAGITGVFVGPLGITELSESDLVVIVGTSLPALGRYGMEEILKEKRIIKLGMKKKSFPLRNLFEVKFPLNNIFQLLKPKKITKKTFVSDNILLPIKFSNSNFNPLTILKAFEKTIEKNSNIFADAGNTGSFLLHYLLVSDKSNFHVALGVGGMGYTFGAGIGAAIANKRKTYVFAGDGSFLMHGLEIHTAIELGLDITFVIFNNNAHAMCDIREDLFLSGETGLNRFHSSFLAKGLKKMFPGIDSFEIYNLSDLKKVLKKTKKGVSVISLNLDPSDMPPFLPFLKKEKK